MFKRTLKRVLVIALLISIIAPSVMYAAAPTEYTVRRGDTLSSIAQRYGVTTAVLIRANNITNSDYLYVGQVLKIPASSNTATSATNKSENQSAATYTVQRGDTLAVIAQRYGVSVLDLAQANDIANINYLDVGQVLRIPASSSSSTSTGGTSFAPSVTTDVPVLTHTVRRGETLSQLASLYGVTAWGIASANNIANPNILSVGAQLVIPNPNFKTSGDKLAPPITAVEFSPNPVEQGHALFVKVMTSEPVSLVGFLDGVSVPFIAGEGYYWALVGISVWAEIGAHPLQLTATTAQGETSESTAWIVVVGGGYRTQYIYTGGIRRTTTAEDLARIQEEREKTTAAFNTISPAPLWSGAFLYPLAHRRVTAPFGDSRSYNGRPVSSYHAGIDYGASAGTAVMAAATGQVVLAEDDLFYHGGMIILHHGLNVFSAYCHLSSVDVQVGQVVNAGDVIGKVGSTGLSTGAHLHWEIRVGQTPVEPTEWTYKEWEIDA